MNLDSMHESVPVIKFTIKIHTITTIHYFITHIKQRKKKTNKKSVSLIQNRYINRVQKTEVPPHRHIQRLREEEEVEEKETDKP